MVFPLFQAKSSKELDVNGEFEVSGLINQLIETCVSGHQSFEAAADAIEDPYLKRELEEYGRQRRQFAKDLNTRLRAFGDGAAVQPESLEPTDPHVLDLSNAVDETTGQSVLADCEQRESSASDAYRKALGASLPAEYSQIVESQYEAIRRAHNRIKILRMATANQWTC